MITGHPPDMNPPPATRGFVADEDDSAHGIEEAAYVLGPSRASGARWPPAEVQYLPMITCMCGWSSGRCDSWEDAGRAFDQHLNSVLKETPKGEGRR